MDDQNLFIRNFWYDGTGPDAYFWVGNTRIPTPKGWVVPYPPVDLYSDLPKSGMYLTRDTVPEIIDSGPMCITDLFQSKYIAYFNPK